MDNIIQTAGVKCEEYRDAGYHCAESIIRACADALDVKLSNDVLKATAGFSGGGGGAREGCGLQAGVALISLIHGRADKYCDDNGCYYLIRLYYERFRMELGSINCKELRPENYYLKGLRDCAPIFPKAAQILTSILLDADKLIAEMPEEERIPHNHGVEEE